MEILPSNRKNKKYMAIFDNNKKIHFGAANSKTFLDHGDETKRKNYIKRHQVNEDFTKINPASLSRYLLWGSTNLNKNINDYKKRFKIK